MATTKDKLDNISYSYEDPTDSGWGLFLILGILLVLAGAFALSAAGFTTVFSILLFGWLLVIGAVIQIISLFFTSRNRWEHFARAILYGLVGLIILSNPGLSLTGLALLLAVLLIVVGIARTIAAMLDGARRGRGWRIFSGIVTFLLGVMIMANWPAASLYIFGLFIGIDLILTGITWIALSMEYRRQLHAPM